MSSSTNRVKHLSISVPMYHDHSLHSFIHLLQNMYFLEIILNCTLMCRRLAHLMGIAVERHVCLALAFYIFLMLPFVRKYYLLNGAINE